MFSVLCHFNGFLVPEGVSEVQAWQKLFHKYSEVKCLQLAHGGLKTSKQTLRHDFFRQCILPQDTVIPFHQIVHTQDLSKLWILHWDSPMSKIHWITEHFLNKCTWEWVYTESTARTEALPKWRVMLNLVLIVCEQTYRTEWTIQRFKARWTVAVVLQTLPVSNVYLCCFE